MSRSGWPAAAAAGAASTATVTPLIRHSIRPMPPPRFAISTSPVTCSPSLASGRAATRASHAAHCRSPAPWKIESRGGLAHEPLRIASELLADQVRPVERLKDLIDSDDRQSASAQQQRASAVRGGSEETFRRYRQPFAVIEQIGGGEGRPVSTFHMVKVPSVARE